MPRHGLMIVSLALVAYLGTRRVDAVFTRGACRQASDVRVGPQVKRELGVHPLHFFENVAVHQGKIQIHVPSQVSKLGRRKLAEEDVWPERWPLRIPLEAVTESTHCQCDSVVETPTFIYALFNFGHFGHTLYDGIVGLYASIREAEVPLGTSQVYFSFHDGPAYREIQEGMLSNGNIVLGYGGLWDDFVLLLTGHTPKGYGHLLQQSMTQRICYKKLVVGSSASASHIHSVFEKPDDIFKPELAIAFGDDMRRLMPAAPTWDSGCRFRIGIIDRKGARKILNVEQLVDALQRELALQQVADACVDRIALEEMPIALQFRVMADIQVLVGVDGTGFLGAMFMPPNCSACVLVTPYLQPLLEPSKSFEFRNICTKISGHFFIHDNMEADSWEYPLGERTEPQALLLDGTPEALKTLTVHPHRHEATRGQDLRFNLTRVTEMASAGIQALLAKPQCGFSTNQPASH